jgi:peroxiredoxin
MKKNILAAVALLLFSSCASSPVQSEGDVAGKVSPVPGGDFSISLDTVDGRRFDFSEIKGKKHLLIAFWATWCEPCKTELRKLSEMYPQYSDRVEFIAVSTDTEESMDKVDMFVAENPMPFPVLIDPSGNTVATMIPGGETVPYTMLVSKDGEIVSRHTGYKPGEEEIIRREIEKLLQK